MSKVAHNVYLQLGTELGVAALVALLILVGGVAWRCWSVFRSAPEPVTRTMGLGLLGAWTALAVAVCFINPLLAFNFSGQFWILLAAASRAAQFAAPAEEAGGPAWAAGPPAASGGPRR
jgi:O-antigen ligase